MVLCCSINKVAQLPCFSCCSSCWHYIKFNVCSFKLRQFKKQVITYKCFRIRVHHANNYQSSLLTDTPYKAGTCVHHMNSYHSSSLMLNIRLVHMYHTNNYQSSLLTLLLRLVHTFITQRITTVVN